MTAARVTTLARAYWLPSCMAAVHAQPPPAAPPPPANPREAAPIDLTGQWVAIVNEDWRWRMVTPPKGDYASVPLNDEGRRVADQWDPTQDGACEAYGAAALLRMPTRVRIRWQGDDRLVVETDAGRQTRELAFGTPAPAASAVAARAIDSEMGDAAAARRRTGARRRRRWRGPRRRLPRGPDDESHAGLAATQRRALQRGRRRDGVLRAVCYADRRRVADGDDDRRRPSLPDAALHRQQPLPPRSRTAGSWNPRACGAAS